MANSTRHELIHLLPESPSYPQEACVFLADRAPVAIAALGNLELLRTKKLALFCSIRCPGKLILATHDLCKELRNGGITVVGGFHSPVERECLNLLLRGTGSIIICPARGLGGIRIPSAWRQPLDQKRLLLLSACADSFRRPTAASVGTRNRLVATLADRVFIGHAIPGGKAESLLKEILAFGKPVCTFDHPLNFHLLAIGARPLPLESRTASLPSQAV